MNIFVFAGGDVIDGVRNASATVEPSAPGVGVYRIPDEQRLLRKLMANYDQSVRPVFNITHSVVVNFSLTLVQIMDMVRN